MSCNCYATLLLRVLILSMASLLIHLKPAILLNYLYHISNLHITIFKLSHPSIQVKYYRRTIRYHPEQALWAIRCMPSLALLYLIEKIGYLFIN